MWIMYQYTSTSKLQLYCISLSNKAAQPRVYGASRHSHMCRRDDLAWLPTSQMDMVLAVAQTCSYCSIICCGVAAVVGDYTRHSSSYVCHATSSGAAACSLFVCYRQHMGQCMICVADCTGISALGAVTLLDVEKLLLR